jgi:hypothetical protein
MTVNLEEDLYVLARSLAKAEDCSISAAVNRLLRRALSTQAHEAPRSRTPLTRNGFIVSRGRDPITVETVHETEAADDGQ